MVETLLKKLCQEFISPDLKREHEPVPYSKPFLPTPRYIKLSDNLVQEFLNADKEIDLP